MDTVQLREFLHIPYNDLEEMNLAAKKQRLDRVDPGILEKERRTYLETEKRIKAVTVLFTDLEGRLHMLDYDKKFLLKSADNLTFDGSSVRGFATQSESDLKLGIDWGAFYWLPSDIFGPGKVAVFGEVQDRDGRAYSSAFRARLREYCDAMYARDKTVCIAATEIEGFLFKGLDAERDYAESGRFDLVTSGGYYHALPQDPLRQFIDRAAEAHRALGLGNEKDHPEVAPSQFEMNFSHAEAVIAADQVQLYKLVCRQVACSLGVTASFLPKPIAGVNGSGMHTNISMARNGKNLFYDAQGENQLSPMANDFVERVLHSATDICLVLNSSVNAYRRLDPAFEAPNQIKSSAINRGAMVRLPLGNERSARVEVRSVAPDANPYLLLYTLFRTGLEGPMPEPTDSEGKRTRTRFLPDNIHDAIRIAKNSNVLSEIMGGDVLNKYIEVKQASADRCPKALGNIVKRSEIMFHHEVTNQILWAQF